MNFIEINTMGKILRYSEASERPKDTMESVWADISDKAAFYLMENRIEFLYETEAISYCPPGILRHKSEMRDVKGYVAAAVIRSEEQELSLDNVCHIVIDRHSEEYEPVHHKPAEHIHLCDIQLPFLYDCWINICILNTLVTVHCHRADTMLKTCIFIEFLHTYNKKGQLCEPALLSELFKLTELLNRDFLLLRSNNLANCRDSLLVLHLIKNSSSLLLL